MDSIEPPIVQIRRGPGRPPKQHIFAPTIKYARLEKSSRLSEGLPKLTTGFQEYGLHRPLTRFSQKRYKSPESPDTSEASSETSSETSESSSCSSDQPGKCNRCSGTRAWSDRLQRYIQYCSDCQANLKKRRTETVTESSKRPKRHSRRKSGTVFKSVDSEDDFDFGMLPKDDVFGMPPKTPRKSRQLTKQTKSTSGSLDSLTKPRAEFLYSLALASLSVDERNRLVKMLSGDRRVKVNSVVNSTVSLKKHVLPGYLEDALNGYSNHLFYYRETSVFDDEDFLLDPPSEFERKCLQHDDYFAIAGIYANILCYNDCEYIIPRYQDLSDFGMEDLREIFGKDVKRKDIEVFFIGGLVPMTHGKSIRSSSHIVPMTLKYSKYKHPGRMEKVMETTFEAAPERSSINVAFCGRAKNLHTKNPQGLILVIDAESLGTTSMLVKNGVSMDNIIVINMFHNLSKTEAYSNLVRLTGQEDLQTFRGTFYEFIRDMAWCIPEKGKQWNWIKSSKDSKDSEEFQDTALIKQEIHDEFDNDASVKGLVTCVAYDVMCTFNGNHVDVHPRTDIRLMFDKQIFADDAILWTTFALRGLQKEKTIVFIDEVNSFIRDCASRNGYKILNDFEPIVYYHHKSPMIHFEFRIQKFMS